MDMHSQKDRHRLLKREDGVVAVEFVILFPLFLLIIVGIVEFGHLFYVRHTLTNASREGARAAVVYYVAPTGGPDRAAWAKDKAEKAVENYLDNFIPGQYDKPPEVTFPDGTAATGNQLLVTVRASKNLLLLDKLVPKFQEITKIETATTMRLE